MADSDSDYDAGNISPDETEVAVARGTRSTGPARGPVGSSTRGGDTNSGNVRRKAAWEDIQRSWDTVLESASGEIDVEGLREAGQRKRFVLVTSTSCKADFVRQIIERYNTNTTRYYSTSHPYNRPLLCYGRKGPAPNTASSYDSLRLRVRDRILRTKPHLPTRYNWNARRTCNSNQ